MFGIVQQIYDARHTGGMLPPRPGRDDAEADDAEELKAVMKRLQDAKPPPDVLKVPHCCRQELHVSGMLSVSELVWHALAERLWLLD